MFGAVRPGKKAKGAEFVLNDKLLLASATLSEVAIVQSWTRPT